MADNRSINIGGSMIGGVCVTGDNNLVSNGNIGTYLNRASRALEDAREELAEETPDKAELLACLNRIEDYINKAKKGL
jgi:hypothetical protein